jgi:FKBP-type peptidyl-prolyl cis-trans isomerase 2
MESSSQAKEPRNPVNMITVILAAVVIVAASTFVYIWYDGTLGPSASSEAIEDGDKALLNYVGRYSNEWVFDTSLIDIAKDDALYPKSLTFTLRENDTYTTFELVAGEDSNAIPGFANGVLGLREGDHRVIEVAPEDGYPLDETRLENASLVDTIPATETLSESEFTSLFGAAATEMAVLPHYMWTWDVMVTSINYGVVTFKSIPEVGQTVYPYGDPTADDPAGWGVKVDAFDWDANGGEGEITISNLITSSEVYTVKGVTYDGVEFILWGVDEANNTFQIHKSDSEASYNAEICGRTLFFEIWIVEVQPA